MSNHFWVGLMAVVVVVQYASIALFALLAGRPGPPRLRGVKRRIERWIERAI